jgi:hypothetical protein
VGVAKHSTSELNILDLLGLQHSIDNIATHGASKGGLFCGGFHTAIDVLE